MNRKQWYEYRRNWRLVQMSLYEDESLIPFERRLVIEKHFSAAQACSKELYNNPTHIPSLWERAVYAIKAGADKRLVFRRVRLYMRRNSARDGRLPPSLNYPVHWEQEITL